jgi:hypothetical protein
MPSFQGSETSSAEVTIYHRGTDPVVLLSAGMSEFTGQRLGDQRPCLLSVQTQKSLSAGSGTWSLAAKPTKGWEDLLDKVVDDDWVDITFTRHGRRWHVMRGMVDEIRRDLAVGGSGATTEVISITGRDFTKVWELTPIWFNRFTSENVAGTFAYKLMTGPNTIMELAIDEAVDLILKGFLQEFGDRGRANWTIPEEMPNTTGPTLVTNFDLRTDVAPGQKRQPHRIAASANFLLPDGNCWALAREWSDPMFCELWADLLPAQAIDQVNEAELTPQSSRMVVTLRDRPFPRLDAGKDSPWFSLPLYTIPRQQLRDLSTGRSGLERYNAFFVSPLILQGTAGSGSIDLNAPLWDKNDIEAHGLRRFDLTTSYVSMDPAVAEQLRERVRDWYCLNPYLLNGTFTTGVGRPDIRVGGRLRIPGQYGEEDQETYYIESIQHNWAFGQGIRTTGGITRGWRGTDDSLLRALGKKAFDYAPGAEAQPGVDYPVSAGVP